MKLDEIWRDEIFIDVLSIPDSDNYFIACLNCQLIGFANSLSSSLVCYWRINEREIQETVVALILCNWNKNQEGHCVETEDNF